jgi:hypothetical protein
LLAARLQFPDYALEVLRFLRKGAKVKLSVEEHAALKAAEHQYLADLRKGRLCLGLLDILKVGRSWAHREGSRTFGDSTRGSLGQRQVDAEYNWVD